MWAIVKKEFQSYFLSPIGYIYIGIFLLMCSIVFYANIFWSIILGGYVDFSNLFKNSMFISVQVILIFIIPLLTRTIIINISKKCYINSFRKIYSSCISCISISCTNFNILCNFMLFWRATTR